MCCTYKAYVRSVMKYLLDALTLIKKYIIVLSRKAFNTTTSILKLLLGDLMKFCSILNHMQIQGLITIDFMEELSKISRDLIFFR